MAIELDSLVVLTLCASKECFTAQSVKSLLMDYILYICKSQEIVLLNLASFRNECPLGCKFIDNLHMVKVDSTICIRH